MSQEIRILLHIIKHGSITPMEALRLYGCFRTASRIHSLRNLGYDIKTDTIEENGKRFAEYYMTRGYRDELEKKVLHLQGIREYKRDDKDQHRIYS